MVFGPGQTHQTFSKKAYLSTKASILEKLTFFSRSQQNYSKEKDMADAFLIFNMDRT